MTDIWLYSSVVERCTCNAAAPGSNPGGALFFDQSTFNNSHIFKVEGHFAPGKIYLVGLNGEL